MVQFSSKVSLVLPWLCETSNLLSPTETDDALTHANRNRTLDSKQCYEILSARHLIHTDLALPFFSFSFFLATMKLSRYFTLDIAHVTSLNLLN